MMAGRALLPGGWCIIQGCGFKIVYVRFGSIINVVCRQLLCKEFNMIRQIDETHLEIVPSASIFHITTLIIVLVLSNIVLLDILLIYCAVKKRRKKKSDEISIQDSTTP
jgi:heme/copper-type cytochrome/quinol oxidase subunit 2